MSSTSTQLCPVLCNIIFIVLYLVKNYCTFKSSRNFTLHTCKTDFPTLFARGLHWHGNRIWPQAPQESQETNGEAGAPCRCLAARRSGILHSNAFHDHGFFALTIILVQREEKESLKFTVKPLCFMPLIWLVLKMRQHLSSRAKYTFGKKGRWNISRSLF